MGHKFEWEISGRGISKNERQIPVGIKERNAKGTKNQSLASFLNKVYIKLGLIQGICPKRRKLLKIWAKQKADLEAELKELKDKYPLVPIEKKGRRNSPARFKFGGKK